MSEINQFLLLILNRQETHTKKCMKSIMIRKFASVLYKNCIIIILKHKKKYSKKAVNTQRILSSVNEFAK